MQVMREEKYCIKIRSLFNIRKEKKISFKRGWKNIHFNFSNNHISSLLTFCFLYYTCKYDPFESRYRGPQDTALGEPKWLHRPGRPLPCRLHGQHPSGILI